MSDAQSELRTSSPPLRNDRRVLAWVVADTVSNIGDGLWVVALVFTAAGLGDPALTGLVIASGTVPQIALLLFGGVLVDRWPTKRVIVGTNIGKAIVMTVGATVVMVHGPSVPLLVGLAVLSGGLDAIHDPAAASLPREMVSADRLVALSGLRDLGFRVASLAGPVLGGLALAAVGLSGVLVLDAISFLWVVATLAFIRTRFERQRQARTNVRREVADGLRYAWRDTLVRDLVLALSALNVFVSPVLSVGVALRVQENGWGPETLGILSACVGFGAIPGTLLTLRWTPPYPLRAALGILVVQAAALMVIGLGQPVIIAMAMLTVGFTAGLASPLLGGTIQRVVDGSFLGRVNGLFSIGDRVLGPVALTAFGVIAGVIGVGASSVLFGGGMAGVLALGLSRPLVRNLAAAGPTSR